MSVGRKTAQFSAAAALVSIAIIAASFLYLGLPNLAQNSYQGPLSVLAIQLTDPPHVPAGTTSLNLTYSSLSLLVGEPTGTPGQYNTKTVDLAGSATLDLLKLQNVSKTVATASLPTGTQIYSVTFTVTGIKIDVSKAISTVTLAAGGNSFTVTMSKDYTLSGASVALVQLNPVVVNTPTGYQLIPSSVGVIRASHGESENKIGSEQTLTNDDHNDLDHAKASVTSSILHLSVAGDVTTLTVRIINNGNVPTRINGIGLAGSFSSTGTPVCDAEGPGKIQPMSDGVQLGAQVDPSTTTTQTQSGTTGQNCDSPGQDEQVVFVPVVPATSTTTTSSSSTTSSTTTTTSSTATVSQSCSTGTMTLASEEDGHKGGLSLSPGQCVELTFTGELAFGPFTFVPSTATGQTYTLHVFASNGADEQQGCKMAHGHDSCDNQ
jgi:hypothetical protein